MILYLHGFASSSHSEKVKTLRDFPEIPVVSFDLNVSPKKAIEQISSFIVNHPKEDIMLMGSSLGGYYALHLSAVFDLPAVLINPSMEPFNTLARFVGIATKNYSKDETFTYKLSDIDELKLININGCDQSKLLVLLQTGDESLDYRLALKALPHAQHCVQEGGNHSFKDFNLMFPRIREFYKKFFKV